MDNSTMTQDERLLWAMYQILNCQDQASSVLNCLEVDIPDGNVWAGDGLCLLWEIEARLIDKGVGLEIV